MPKGAYTVLEPEFQPTAGREGDCHHSRDAHLPQTTSFPYQGRAFRQSAG